jgi:hypothetical protein
MAYRLVTDEYPPLTHPEEPGSQVWREAGSGPRPPSALNPRVGPELDSLVLRLLAVAPDERFQGVAQEAVKATEQAREALSPETDPPLFDWGYEHRPRVRSPKAVQLAEKREAAAREELARRSSRERTRSSRAQVWTRIDGFTQTWSKRGALATAALLLVLLVGVALHRAHEVLTSTPREVASTAVGDSVIRAPGKTPAAKPQDARAHAVSQPLPEKPLPDQRRPPCNPNGHVELRGGCWYRVGNAKPPCEEGTYAWQGACYFPVPGPRRQQPTADPP